MNPDPQAPQDQPQPQPQPQPLTPPQVQEMAPQPLTPAVPQPLEEQQPQPVQPEAPSTQPEPVQQSPFFSAQQPQPFGPVPSTTTPDIQSQPTPPLVSQPAPGAPVPTGKKPLNKKLLAGIIAGAAVLVIAIVAIVLYMTVFMVKKEDYQAVETQITAMSDKISENPLSSAGENSTDASLKRLDELKTEHAKLADLKAVKYDSELREKFEAYDTKVQGYISFMEDFLPSLGTFTDAAKEAQSKISPVSVAGLQAAADVYKKAADEVKDPGIKAFLNESATAYSTAAGAYSEYQSATTATERTAAQSKFREATTSLTAAVKTMTDDTGKRVEEVNPKETYNAFRDLLNEKIAQ